MNFIETRNAAHRPENEMARIDKDDDYEWKFTAAFRRAFRELVADGFDEETAELDAKQQAEKEMAQLERDAIEYA